MARRNQEFQTIHSEGGLLPADLLRRVLDRSSNLHGTRPEDYGLPGGERLNEVITQSWNRLRKHWAEFRETAANLPVTEAGTGLTNDRWNLPLLRELGFGLLPSSAGPEIGGRTYAISRFFGPVPVHLIGCNLSLDRRSAGQRGAAAGNPHGLVQEFLNRSDAHLWALLSNGLRLRILRDNQALSRQSFLEFDLEAMMSGEVYSDFVLLWLVAHATRFAPREGDRPETCWLEQWTQEAEEQGTRALGELRCGVEQALAILGEGFTSHPKNAALRDALRSSALSPIDLHAQLLRLVYRLIFLFVAEDRSLEGQPLIHPLDNSDAARAARERYAMHYGTARLREMAGIIKGSRHSDLWRQFDILVHALSGDAESETIRRALALPALGSFLWDPASTPDLNDTELTNFDLLEALRHLAYTRQGKVLRPVDYKNLGAEELGGVYESLLALTPQVSGDGARFSFAEFAGNERKTSGSYYTPDSLVQCVLDSALDPVVEEAIKGKPPTEAENAILALKICDPAVGSGHFLVGAAHRLAHHLARLRALAEGESEPSPLLYQHALRDVIGRCLYGVDVNPMAAELCRVSLWLEALEPGKPLSFLDHHIRVGNSLLGATPELIAGGLPDDAFKPIEGDDKKVCAALKKRNNQERDGKQMDLGLTMVAEARAEYDTLASGSQGIDQAPDDSLEALERKAEQFRRLVVSSEYRHQQTVADAWCAAFVWPKTADAPTAITTDMIRRLEADVASLDVAQSDALQQLTSQYQFFHWELAFPEVFVQGGFDCILGNPPWERLKLQEQEWFAARLPEIALAKNAARRRAMIKKLQSENASLYKEFQNDLRKAAAEVAFLRNSGVYPLCGVGRDINTAAVFLELMYARLSNRGVLGCIAPASSLSGDTTKDFVKTIVDRGALRSLYHFENEELIFRGVHHAFRFCIATISGGMDSEGEGEFVYYARAVSDLREPDRAFGLSKTEVRVLNPGTNTLPAFRYAKDAALSLGIYRRTPVIAAHELQDSDGLGDVLTRPGHYHMSNDAEKFLSNDEVEYRRVECAPLFESKMIASFDHRFGTYEGQTVAQANQGKLPETRVEQHADPTYLVTPRYWVERSDLNTKRKGAWESKWSVGVRDIMSSSNERTAIAAVLPDVAIGGTLMLVTSTTLSAIEHLFLVAAINSYIFDYCARQKVTGMHLNPSIFRQLPVPPAATMRKETPFRSRQPATAWVGLRAMELTYSAWDLRSFAEACGWEGPPFRWDEERRFLIRCELDAAFFHLYLPADESGGWRPARKADGCPYDETPEQIEELTRHFATPRDAVDYIMDTFPIVRRKDEEAHGEYRTKRVILEIYDAMQKAIRTGLPYETRLDPPSGPPLDTVGNFVSYAEIADNPPPHMHLPRDATLSGHAALQVSDLSAHFPEAPFRLRLNTVADAGELCVRPVPTSALGPADTVVIASPQLRLQGAPVPAAIGRLRVESRTDAKDGSSYVLVSVRGEDGLAQARFSEDEWRTLVSVGVIGDSARAEAADG